MKKFGLLGGVGTAFAFAGAAWAVDLPVDLKDGDSWTQVVTHSRSTERRGETKSGAMTTTLKATYQTSDEQPATVTFDWVSAQASEGAQDDVNATSSLLFPAITEVDEALTPTRLVNWADLRAAMDAHLSKSVTDSAGRAAVRSSYADLTPEQAAGAFLRDQTLVTLGQSLSLELGEAVSYEDSLPNPLGGPSVGAIGTFKLISHDAKRAIVTWDQTLDPESAAASAKASVQAMLSRMSPEQVEAARPVIETMTLDRHDACRYDIDVATGLATTTECTSKVLSGTKDDMIRRTDHWTITQSPPGRN